MMLQCGPLDTSPSDRKKTSKPIKKRETEILPGKGEADNGRILQAEKSRPSLSNLLFLYQDNAGKYLSV